MNYPEYRKTVADNKEFWEIEGIDAIIEFLKNRNINYLIYCLGEVRAADISILDRPVVTMELRHDVERMKVMRYFATHQLFTMHLEKP